MILFISAFYTTGLCFTDYTIDNDTFCTTLKVGATGDIGSSSNNYPIARIRQGEAIHACSGLSYNGKTSHLLTNNEWMAIARNIEQKGQNWSSGTKGTGFLYSGHNDWGPTSTLPASSNDNDGYNGTGDSASSCDGAFNNYVSGDNTITGRACLGQKRTLTLSNDKVIWDLSGNVWEHVNKSNLPTTSNARATNTWNSSTTRVSNACNGVNNWASFSGNDGVAACTYTNSYTYANIGPATANLNASNGIGRIYSYNTASNIFLRGGSAQTGAHSGVFTMDLYWVATFQNHTVGFRCAF